MIRRPPGGPRRQVPPLGCRCTQDRSLLGAKEPPSAGCAAAAPPAAGRPIQRAYEGALPPFNAARPATPLCAVQPAKRARTILQENMGTSLIEYFNRQQILLHLEKLKASPQPSECGRAARAPGVGVGGWVGRLVVVG